MNLEQATRELESMASHPATIVNEPQLAAAVKVVIAELDRKTKALKQIHFFPGPYHVGSGAAYEMIAIAGEALGPADTATNGQPSKV